VGSGAPTCPGGCRKAAPRPDENASHLAAGRTYLVHNDPLIEEAVMYLDHDAEASF